MNWKRTALISLILVLLLGLGCVLWLHGQQRQYALNRQLIAALVKNDDWQAPALVEAGADPNTHYKPTPLPSLPELVKQLFHRSPPTVNDSPTAFLIVCGASVSTDEGGMISWGSYDAELTQAMMTHGANVYAKDEDERTSLMYAAQNGGLDTVRLLLQHAAYINAKDTYGQTPLIYAASNAPPDVVRLLLEHGANVDAKDKDGMTPLNLAQGHPDIIALFRHAGARK